MKESSLENQEDVFCRSFLLLSFALCSNSSTFLFGTPFVGTKLRIQPLNSLRCCQCFGHIFHVDLDTICNMPQQEIRSAYFQTHFRRLSLDWHVSNQQLHRTGHQIRMVFFSLTIWHKFGPCNELCSHLNHRKHCSLLVPQQKQCSS